MEKMSWQWNENVKSCEKFNESEFSVFGLGMKLEGCP